MHLRLIAEWEVEGIYEFTPNEEVDVRQATLPAPGSQPI